MIHAAVRKFLFGTGILAVVVCACVAAVPTYLLHAHGMAVKAKAQATSAASQPRPGAPNPVRLADRMLFEKLFSATRLSAQPPLGIR